MSRFFLSLFLLFSISLPASYLHAADESCGESTIRCECTDEDGLATDSTDDTLTDSDLCAEHCASRSATSYAFYCGESNTATDAGDISAYLDAVAASAGNTVDVKENAKIPALNVPIPGLDLVDSVGTDSEGNITVNMIGLYVNAVFAYGIILTTLFAVLMLTIAGFQYMTAGGSKGAVTKAKTRMQNALIGLVILMASYSIMFIVDPRTTFFNPLTLEHIARVDFFPPEGEDTNIAPNTALDGTSEAISGNYLIASKANMTLDPDALSALQEVATAFHATYNKSIVVASAQRDLSKQAELFYNNCLARGGYCKPDTCNPASSSVVAKSGTKYTLTGALAGVTDKDTIISTLSNPSYAMFGNCPHTSAIAIDLWCDDGGSDYKHDPVCQGQLINAMISSGNFCRLKSEPWHFEYLTKKVSTSCTTGYNTATYTTSSGTHTPSTDCRRWDFKEHTCSSVK